MIKIYLMRFFLRFLYVFPIKKNRVVLTAYSGRQFSCNPKYIAIKLDSKKFDIIFALKKDCKHQIPKGITRVNYRSFKHIYFLMTAKYIVVNSTGFTCLLPLRKSQVLINTWHGGGSFKKTGVSHSQTKEELLARRIMGKNTTYFVSTSKVFGDQQTYSMCIDSSKLLNIGAPRNDLFFYKNNKSIIEKVRKEFKIPSEYGIILYAPTYRDGDLKSINEYGFKELNIENVLKEIEKKFNKKFVFLFRAHHNMIPKNIDSNCLNASSYADVQELLYASDILITDYSACMWDFALMNKPGFLYAPDLEKYQTIRKFASPIEEWPYKYAKTNKELIKLIDDFNDKENKERIKEYFERLGSYETGEATEKIIKLFK